MLVLAVLACYGAEGPPLCFLLSMLDICFISDSYIISFRKKTIPFYSLSLSGLPLD